LKILYLSSLGSKGRNKVLFTKYQTFISHASQKFHRLLVEGLKENGCEIDLLSVIPITKNMDKKIFHTPSTEIEDQNSFSYVPRINIPILGSIFTIIYSLKEIIYWTRENKEGIVLCDPIVGEFSLAIWLSSKIIKYNKIAIITDVPGFRATLHKRKGFSALLEELKKKSIRKFNGYILLTEQMNSLINKNNNPYVIIEGFADIKLKDFKNSLNNKYDKKVCFMAGSLDKIFGVELLVNSFIKANVKDSELHLYGKGDYVEDIKNICNKYSNIKYFGELPNELIIQEELRATLLINPRPSKDEYTKYSFPSKNIEYISSGTPLVANVLPGMPKEYYDFFIHIEEESIEGMSNTLRHSLSKSKEELHDFGSNSKEWIINNKNNIIQCSKIFTMLEEISNKYRAEKEIN
jgi:hypothetical protein